MHKIFQWAFGALRPRRGLLAGSVLVASLLCLGLASRLSLRENVFDMLPAGDKTIDDFHAIVSRFGLQNRLFFDVGEGGWTENCAAADELYGKLSASGCFKNIRYRVQQEEGLAALELIQGHMPALFGAGEEKRLLPLLEEDKLRGQLAGYKKMLMEAPAAGPLAGMARGDPLGLQAVFLSKMAGFYDGAELRDGRICSPGGEHLLMAALPADGYAQGARAAEMIAFVDKARAAAAAAHPGVRIRYTGAPRITVENQDMMRHDITLTMAASTLLILVFTFLVYRRFSLALAGLLPVAFGGILAAGVFALFSDKISAIVAGFGGALIGIAVDCSVHILYRYDNFDRLEEGPEPLGRHLSVIIEAVVMASATTIAAFLCLLLSSSPGQRQLGAFAALGITGAALFSVIVLPQLLPLRRPARQKAILPLASLWRGFFEWHARHTGLCLGFVLVFSLFCAFGLPRLTFDGDLRRMNGMRPATAGDEQAVSDRWGGKFLKNTLIAVRGASMEEARLKNDRLYALLRELERSGSVKRFTSISPIAPALGTQLENAARWRAVWTPARVRLLKSRLGKAGAGEGFSTTAFEPFYRKLERKAATLPPEELKKGALGAVTEGFISEKEGEVFILTEVQAAAGHAQLSGQVLAALPDAYLYEGNAFARRISELVKEGLKLFIWCALAGSLVILLLVYGRLEMTLLVIAVLALDALWSLGLMGWFGLRVDLMNNIFSLFIFGMCIDYVIFVVSAFLDRYKDSSEDIGVAGGALTISAVTAIGGFAALLAAQHPALRSLGLAACLVMVNGLLAAVIVPPIAMRFLLWGNGRQGTPTLVSASVGLGLIGIFALALVYCRLFFMPWLQLRHAGEPALRRKALQSFLRTCCRLLFSLCPYGKRIFLNAGPESFAKPAVLICNHQSVIDIICALNLPADLRMVVKPWVWNSFFMGPVIREAGYILSDGENTAEVFEKAAQCLREGDFLMFFPEGTRSDTGQISRFKKGAFEIAARAGAELLPVVMCETRSCIPKTGFWLPDHGLVVSVMPRLSAADPGETARAARKLMEEEYERVLAIACDGPGFFSRMRQRYNYLGPYIEQYTAWKLRLDPLFGKIAGLVPREGVVLDLGQGYGLMSNILAAQSTRRSIIGIDFDADKVAAARKSAVAPERMTSELGDILDSAFPPADTALLIDVLHYWPEAEQEKILLKTFACLKPGGRLILRENCADGSVKGGAVRLAELFAVFIGHNKSRHGVVPGNRENYLRLLRKIGFNCSEAVNDLGWRSNLVFICEKPA